MSATPHIADPNAVRHAPASPRLIEVPWRRFLAIDGRGEPGGDAFQAAVKALYSIAYGARFGLRREGIASGRIGSLEGFFTFGSDEPAWTLALPAPVAVTADGVEEVR